MIEIFQNKSKTFLQSNQHLHLVDHHCSLIVKDQFGAVGTMQMVNWDWETQRTETKQKRFKDFLQSNQWQEDVTMHCFLIVKDQFGAVGTMEMETYLWQGYWFLASRSPSQPKGFRPTVVLQANL